MVIAPALVIAGKNAFLQTGKKCPSSFSDKKRVKSLYALQKNFSAFKRVPQTHYLGGALRDGCPCVGNEPCAF